MNKLETKFKLKSKEVSVVSMEKNKKIIFDDIIKGEVITTDEMYLVNIVGTSRFIPISVNELNTILSTPKPKKAKKPSAKEFIKRRGLESEFKAWQELNVVEEQNE